MSTDSIVVAIFGCTGYLGKWVTDAFLDGLKCGRISELRIVTRRDLSDSTIQGFASRGAKIFHSVIFSNPESLNKVLRGCSGVTSMLGTGIGSEESNRMLLDAIVNVGGVKVFIPSDFGTNHYKINADFHHPNFKGKRAIHELAKAKGLNSISIQCAGILEASIGRWYGLDCAAEVWTIVENGDVPIAMTSEKDIGRFTLETVLLALTNPEKIPSDILEVYSDMKTLQEYALTFDLVAGRSMKINIVRLEDARKNYERCQNFEMLVQMLMPLGAYDYTKANGNPLLNPQGLKWKLTTIEDYAKETGGRPWKNFKLNIHPNDAHELSSSPSIVHEFAIKFK